MHPLFGWKWHKSCVHIGLTWWTEWPLTENNFKYAHNNMLSEDRYPGLGRGIKYLSNIWKNE